GGGQELGRQNHRQYLVDVVADGIVPRGRRGADRAFGAAKLRLEDSELVAHGAREQLGFTFCDVWRESRSASARRALEIERDVGVDRLQPEGFQRRSLRLSGCRRCCCTRWSA